MPYRRQRGRQFHVGKGSAFQEHVFAYHGCALFQPDTLQVGAAREHGHFYAVYARWYDDGLQGCAAAECVGFDSCDTFSDSCTSQAGTALEHG